MTFTYDVSKYTPTQLCVIPMVLLVLSLILLGFTYIQTGLPVTPGIEFQGGISATLISDAATEEIEAVFSNFPLISINEGIAGGKYLKFEPMDDNEFRELSSLIDERYPGARVDQIGESFGETLQSQALMALLLSFIGMGIVVTIVFRNIIPALAVIISSFADIAMTAAVMNILGIQLSLGTTAALLMLIAYSVDSDILLSKRVLQRKGKFDEKVQGAFHTGFVMTTTTIAAIFAMWLVTTIAQITIISEMSAVLLIGLLFDLLNTWVTNVAILKWHSEGGTLSRLFKLDKKVRKA
ncbi:MAG: protein translocase subunit SecF [Methanomicrobiales archaeon]|jgi:preprotein translocase subunit SecF|nr:protein translocase subunit SecF [Methanomicrobiales archaeon]